MSISQAAIDKLLAQNGQAESTGQADATVAEAPVKESPRSTASPEKARAIPDINRILHLEVPLSVTLAERLISIEMALEVRVGTIIEFEESFDEDLTLNVGKRPIAKGQAVKIGENFGIRVTRVGTVEDRIEAMGGGPGS
ncbi:MAG: FliM/FliN family flagellar motor switch protein [Phycisphaerales bacterium]|nr:MAG: FliM/FliN family flagellar motor switch protein [Phycisphaerales bacterium]